jgi:hypothetical protein
MIASETGSFFQFIRMKASDNCLAGVSPTKNIAGQAISELLGHGPIGPAALENNDVDLQA